MADFGKLLQDYVRLLVRVGLNVQKGQKVVISSPVECAEIARLAVKEAYAAGAHDVYMRWMDDQMMRIRYDNAPDAVFDEYPEWQKMMLDTLSEQRGAFLSISASDPEVLLGVDTDKIMRQQAITREKLKDYQRRTMNNEVQWTVASVPTPKWAMKVFPDAANEADAVEKLWRAIFAASRVDGNDPAANWERHKQELGARAKKLNDYQFKTLRFKNGAGTDLVIGLPDGHKWICAGERSAGGADFLANIPTEEIFTAPHKDTANGRVVSTKPLVFNGNLIEDFTVDFKDGVVTNVTAKKNEDLLKKLLSNVENADRLGEIALVPFRSPISDTNVLFYNTLYDENASCHLAFGKAYPSCLNGGETMSKDELAKAGINESLEHSDFMIGSADMSIVGVCADGTEVDVFVDGNFAF
jgi:aminopeptidase